MLCISYSHTMTFLSGDQSMSEMVAVAQEFIRMLKSASKSDFWMTASQKAAWSSHVCLSDKADLQKSTCTRLLPKLCIGLMNTVLLHPMVHSFMTMQVQQRSHNISIVHRMAGLLEKQNRSVSN